MSVAPEVPGVSRRPTPTAKRELEGNPQRRPMPENEPVLPVAEPDTFDAVPEELEKNELGKREWTRLAPMLRKARIITDGDRAVVIAVCQQWALYRTALEKVDTAGLVVTSPSGYPMPNPYIGIANKALQACLRMWIELGITPAARTKVEAVDGEGIGGRDDDFSEFDEEEPSSGRKPN